MGWFDEQIRLRKINDDELMEESFLDMAGAVMGMGMQASLESNRVKTKNAIDAILLDEACQTMIAGRFDCLQQTYHKYPA